MPRPTRQSLAAEMANAPFLLVEFERPKNAREWPASALESVESGIVASGHYGIFLAALARSSLYERIL